MADEVSRNERTKIIFFVEWNIKYSLSGAEHFRLDEEEGYLLLHKTERRKIPLNLKKIKSVIKGSVQRKLWLVKNSVIGM
jgi:hypothetical protein